MQPFYERPYTFEIKGLQFVVIRLTDAQFLEQRRRAMPIAEDTGFLWDLEESQRENGVALNLAQIDATLTMLFGLSGTLYDDWKGAFAFPFTVEVKRDNRMYPYLLKITNIRSTVEYRLYRLLSSEIVPSRDDIEIICAPFENEFARDQINMFLSYLIGAFSGAFSVLRHTFQTPCIKQVCSNHILFGYMNNEFFEIHYDTEEAFHQAQQCYGLATVS